MKILNVLQRLRPLLGAAALLVLVTACASNTDTSASEAVTEATPALDVAPLIIPTGPPPDIDPRSLVGSYGGEFTFDDETGAVLVIAEFALSGTNELRVNLGFPLLEDLAAISSPVQLYSDGDQAGVTFAIPFERAGRSDPVIFAGLIGETEIAGVVSQGNTRGVFALIPIAEFAPEIFEGRTQRHNYDSATSTTSTS